MGNVNLKTSGGGNVIIAPATTATDKTITAPATTGTMIATGDSGTVTQTMLASNVAGNGPAFNAYASVDQTVSSASTTKVSLNNKDFDTANAFDATTNYRFTAPIAGYYQFNAVARVAAGTNITGTWLGFYKNGSLLTRGQELNGTFGGSQIVYSALISLALSDYIELYVYLAGTGTLTIQNSIGSQYTARMSGFLARSA